jgi:hypothetical protein
MTFNWAELFNFQNAHGTLLTLELASKPQARNQSRSAVRGNGSQTSWSSDALKGRGLIIQIELYPTSDLPEGSQRDPYMHFFYFIFVLEIKPRAPCMLSTYSSIELQPQIYRFGGTGI